MDNVYPRYLITFENLKTMLMSKDAQPVYSKTATFEVFRFQLVVFSKQITQLTFDLISPNMANISQNLELNLKQLYEDTNTHKTKVELSAEKESHLEIKESSKFVNSLAQYSEDGEVIFS